MTQSEFLLQYKDVIVRIKLNREKMLKAEREARECMSSKMCVYLSEYQDRLYEETEELIKLKYAIELAVERCPCSETERQLLYRRYILCEKWTDISAEMLYSIQHLHRLNNKVLKLIKMPQ